MDPHSQTCPARSNGSGRGMFLFYGWAAMVCYTLSLKISPVMALST